MALTTFTTLYNHQHCRVLRSDFGLVFPGTHGGRSKEKGQPSLGNGSQQLRGVSILQAQGLPPAHIRTTSREGAQVLWEAGVLSHVIPGPTSTCTLWCLGSRQPSSSATTSFSPCRPRGPAPPLMHLFPTISVLSYKPLYWDNISHNFPI